MSATGLQFDLLDDTGRLGVACRAWITDRIQAVAAVLGMHGEIRVRVLDDQAMAAAHKEFLGVEGTTDVLTFDLQDREGATTEKPDILELGSYKDRSLFAIDSDILLCLDEALRHSTPGGYPVERELLLYVVHGVLHCLGWDDHEEAEAAAMHQLEDAVLKAVGVGPVFRLEA
ncbi:Endoribonuclease YbeY [Phycisphaerales bacterium]|nr:Endoribonuclease YbeY [Phycisphaerales bacterium]